MKKKPHMNAAGWRAAMKSFADGGECHAIRPKVIPILDEYCKAGRNDYTFPVNVTEYRTGTRIERGRKACLIRDDALLEFCRRYDLTMHYLETALIALPFTYEEWSRDREKRLAIRKARQEAHKRWELIRKAELESWAAMKLRKGEVHSTIYEERMYNHLTKAGFNVKRQYEIYVKHKIYFLDLYIESARTAVEVDGDYHLGQLKKDRQRDADILEVHNIRTYRIKNEDVGNLKERTTLLQRIRGREGALMSAERRREKKAKARQQSQKHA